MKKMVLFTVGVVLLIMVIIFTVVPAFAHGPSDRNTDHGTWDAMHEACENGDYQAMVDAAEEIHEDLGDTCYGEDDYTDGGSVGGHMGGGMTGSGWGGMMH